MADMKLEDFLKQIARCADEVADKPHGIEQEVRVYCEDQDDDTEYELSHVTNCLTVCGCPCNIELVIRKKI